MTKKCVDDEKEIADLVDAILKSEGYETIKFYNSTVAKKAIETNSEIELVILDVMMPGIPKQQNPLRKVVEF